MKYFSTLPLITQTDPQGNSIVVNNIMSRAQLMSSLRKNLMLFYAYEIKEVDSPENMSYRYYNDTYRYWILLYSNGIIDPYSEWPLNNQQLNAYLYDKYKDEVANSFQPPISSSNVSLGLVMSYITSTTHHYEKYITTTNSVDQQGQKITIQIDKDTYESFQESSITSTFSNGITVTKTENAEAISIFDYEEKMNENKRNIQIMRDIFVPQTESQFKILMR